MYGNSIHEAVEQARQEGFRQGAAMARQEAMTTYAEQVGQIEQKDAEITALERQLVEVMQANGNQATANPPSTSDKTAEQSAALAVQRAEIDDLRIKLRNEHAEKQRQMQATAQKLVDLERQIELREKKLVERTKALVVAEQQQAITSAHIDAAQRGDFGFITASLAKQVAICDQRAAKALVLADAQSTQLADYCFEARQEAQRWMQESRKASQALAALPRPKEVKGLVDVTAICTSTPFIEACHRLATASPGRYIGCSGLVTSLLLEMPELRTINNGQPLTARQLGNAFAGIGIRADPRKINGKSERCYAASAFVILSSGHSQNALPSQGSGQRGDD